MFFPTLKHAFLAVVLVVIVVLLGRFLSDISGIWGIASAAAFSFVLILPISVTSWAFKGTRGAPVSMCIDTALLFFAGGMFMLVAGVWGLLFLLASLIYYVYHYPSLLIDDRLSQ